MSSPDAYYIRKETISSFDSRVGKKPHFALSKTAINMKLQLTLSFKYQCSLLSELRCSQSGLLACSLTHFTNEKTCVPKSKMIMQGRVAGLWQNLVPKALFPRLPQVKEYNGVPESEREVFLRASRWHLGKPHLRQHGTHSGALCAQRKTRTLAPVPSPPLQSTCGITEMTNRIDEKYEED